MVPATTEQLTVHGTIRGGQIVFDVPLDLPEGTEVVLGIRVVSPAHSGEPPGGEAAAETEEVAPVLTDEELHDWVTKHPAPQEWWDATDNPYEPAPAAEEQRPGRLDAPAEG